MDPVSFDRVRIERGFWADRIHTIRERTAWACIDECERTHRVDNFRRAGGTQEGGFEGIYFNDSDVYKVLEGVAYVLMQGGAPELERKADEIIDAICSAQQPDGYLYTYFILNTPENRWTDMNLHEAYCLGHMLEGAIAYARATGKEKWLNAARRALDQMMEVNGPEGRHWVTGHEELELALVKLYRYTGEEKYIDYARWLVEERGHGHLRVPLSPEIDPRNTAYCQDDVPVRELSRVTGHAVRAMYYYSGVTDLAALLGEKGYEAAMLRVWNSVVPANLYITGGIGQSASNEGFTKDWSLPSLTAYCETCAAIGMALWNRRMELLHGDSRYADLVELEMYNGILAGISLEGDRFFYDNPLASAGTHHRRKWFGCSCCPTNLVRFIPSVGDYVCAIDGEMLVIDQFNDSDVCVDVGERQVHFRMSTDYPWDGRVRLTVDGFGGNLRIKLRKPGWCRAYSLARNGIAVETCDEGYCTLDVSAGDLLEYGMDMPVRREYADARVRENAGRVAVMRGPVVYCAEEIDNPGIPSEYFHAGFCLPKDAELCAEWMPSLLGGVVRLQGAGVTLVPYYAWDNRQGGGMAVWMKEV